MRTRARVKPVYISQGQRVSLETAIELTLRVAGGARIPKPMRVADQFVAEVKRKEREQTEDAKRNDQKTKSSEKWID